MRSSDAALRFRLALRLRRCSSLLDPALWLRLGLFDRLLDAFFDPVLEPAELDARFLCVLRATFLPALLVLLLEERLGLCFLLELPLFFLPFLELLEPEADRELLGLE